MEENWNGNANKKLKPWQGLVMFFLVMLCFYTVIAWVQWKLGMYGLALTELFLLALALGGTKLCGASMTEVFPVKKPKAKKILAVFLSWISAYCAVIPLTMLVTYFFPEEMYGVSSSLNDVLYSVPIALTIFISSILPGICEEALHRGFLLKSFQSKIRNRWVLVILMGFLFGAFHGNIWRFLPTALLGGVLTYLMVETENLFYPALFHFANNLMPSLLAGFSQGESSEAAVELLANQGLPLSFLGIYLAFACVAPFGFYTAGYLLRKGEAEKEQKYVKSNATLVLLTIFTVLPILIGMVVFLYGLFTEFF